MPSGVTLHSVASHRKPLTNFHVPHVGTFEAVNLDATTVGEFPLGVQGWFGASEPDPNLFRKPDVSTMPTAKPKDGYFTSTWDPLRRSTPWCDFLRSGSHRADEERRLWALAPDPTARLYIIDSVIAYRRLVDVFPHLWKEEVPLYLEVDWHGLAHADDRPFEGIHATTEAIQAGTAEVRRRGHPHFWGWQVESTLWLRWSFTGWRNVG
jgi:hypothetical protein